MDFNHFAITLLNCFPGYYRDHLSRARSKREKTDELNRLAYNFVSFNFSENLRRLLPNVEFDGPIIWNMPGAPWGEVSEELARNLPCLESFCKKIAKFGSYCSSGFMFAEDFYGFDGLFLHLNMDGYCVGTVGFKIGIPLEIDLIQGAKPMESFERSVPGRFFRKTGKHFEEALIDELISAINESFPVPENGRWPAPLLKISPNALFSMKPATRARLQKYVGRRISGYNVREKLKRLGLNVESRLPELPVSYKFFSERKRAQEPHKPTVRRRG